MILQFCGLSSGIEREFYGLLNTESYISLGGTIILLALFAQRYIFINESNSQRLKMLVKMSVCT